LGVDSIDSGMTLIPFPSSILAEPRFELTIERDPLKEWSSISKTLY